MFSVERHITTGHSKYTYIQNTRVLKTGSNSMMHDPVGDPWLIINVCRGLKQGGQ